VADFEIQGHPKCPFAAVLISKNQYRQTFRRKAPHDAERICFTEEKNISTAEHDREDLQSDDQIENAMGGAECPMRMAKPLRKNPVFGYPVQYAVGSDDGGVHRAC